MSYKSGDDKARDDCELEYVLGRDESEHIQSGSTRFKADGFRCRGSCF